MGYNNRDAGQLIMTTIKKSLPFFIAAGLLTFITSMLKTATFGLVVTGILVLLIYYTATAIRTGEENLQTTLILGVTYVIGIAVVKLISSWDLTNYMIDFSNYDSVWLLLPIVLLLSIWYLSDAFVMMLYKRLNIKL